MTDRTVVVTGADEGLGAAVARAFAEEGTHVVCAGTDDAALADVAADVADAGGDATAVRADVRDEFDVELLMEQAARIDGAVDVVVAAAATNHDDGEATPLHLEAYSRFDDTVRTNLRGVFATLKEAHPHLAPDGRVLVVSDPLSATSSGTGAYAVSRIAVRALVEGFASGVEPAVGVVDAGGEDPAAGGEASEHATLAQRVVRAAVDLPADELDGQVIDLNAHPVE